MIAALLAAALLGAEATVTGLPALLIILVILAIPVGLGIMIGRGFKRRRSAE